MSGGVPRVGVFLCHCGNNIGGVVNLPAVAEYVRGLEGVVYVEENTHTCSSEGLARIKEAVKTRRLERVVVASCTPRTHEPLFMDAVEEAGLNRYLFQMVNIREHDSWVHGNNPEAATAKAKALVRMGVEKAKMLEPEEEPLLSITPSCLVVGGGASGLTAAHAVVSQGFHVVLVEKEDELGGLLRSLHLLAPGWLEAGELLGELVRRVESSDVEVHLGSRVVAVEGYLGHFKVALETPGGLVEREVGTIIVATGAQPLEPLGLHGLGEDPRVVTQLQLEEMLGEPGFQPPQSVAMIQCAGSMDRERPYCSRVCCGVALKNAVTLKRARPGAEVYILYRQLMAYGVELEELYQEALRLGVRFVKYLPEDPPRLTHGDQLTLEVGDPLTGGRLSLHPDLVVLSTPLVPREETAQLARTLRVPLNPHGFLLEAHPKIRPVDMSSEGIYVAGTAHSPMNLAESMAQALGAAAHALIPLSKGSLRAQAILAEVDPSKCVGCGACASVCPYGAIYWSPTGFPRVKAEGCKGCGLCSVECPVSAMQLKYFKDPQLFPAIRGILTREVGGDPSEPLVLVFACRWCCYAAADLAGVMRLHYPPNVRILLVPCTGRVDFSHIYEAFNSGADGVVVAGCLKDQCHYVDGNLVAERRVRQAKKALEVLGVNPARLKMVFNSAGMPRELVSFLTEFTERVKELGRVEGRLPEAKVRVGGGGDV